jgi:ech hydrogenase subunit D
MEKEMIEEQKIMEVKTDDLELEVKKLLDESFRLVQISCTKISADFQLNYTFDKQYLFLGLRLHIDSVETEIPSISKIYPNAFLYENEIHDLFGIRIKGITIDYQGRFYRISERFPFSSQSGESVNSSKSDS